MDRRIHQRKDGTRYVRSEEFVNSDAGKKLLDRFSESVEAENKTKSKKISPVEGTDSKTYSAD